MLVSSQCMCYQDFEVNPRLAERHLGWRGSIIAYSEASRRRKPDMFSYLGSV